MVMICDNPKCQYHRPKVGPNLCYERLWSTQPNRSAREVIVYRYLYRRINGEQLYLCEVCHTATQMALGNIT